MKPTTWLWVIAVSFIVVGYLWLNFRNVWLAGSFINGEESDFNDLREFFPDGLNPVESL